MPDRVADEQGPALPRGLFRCASPSRRLYLHPVGLTPTTDDAGLRLAGGSLSFAACEVVLRDGNVVRGWVAPVGRILDWAASEGMAVERHVSGILTRLAEPRPLFGGFPLDRPLVMGIVNATPDSFHDRGAHGAADAAITHGRRLAADGADIVDVGGESTRPGADPVSTDEELERVLPVLRGLAACGAAISVDTYKAGVMEAALAAGAAIVNDVTALTGDPRSLAVVAAAGVPVILGHRRGEPKMMNVAPAYRCAPVDVYDELEERVAACLAAGIERANIAVDPGFGFGKSPAHNTRILGCLALLHGLGCAVVVGASHKAFEADIVHWAPRTAPTARSLAAALAAIGRGAGIVRVHDVAEMRAALARVGADRL